MTFCPRLQGPLTSLSVGVSAVGIDVVVLFQPRQRDRERVCECVPGTIEDFELTILLSRPHKTWDFSCLHNEDVLSVGGVKKEHVLERVMSSASPY